MDPCSTGSNFALPGGGCLFSVPRPPGTPPSPLWPRPRGVRCPWKPPFTLGLGVAVTDPQMSTAATRVWQRQHPRALGPHRVSVPALCCPQALGELGFSPPREVHRAPGPRTHYSSSSPPVGPPGPTRRQRAAGLTRSRALASRCKCEVGQGAHCTPVVAREPRIKTS